MTIADRTRPLRKIVRTVSRPGPLGYHSYIYEVLECGHEQRQKSDMYGPTNAYRRRCGKCAVEQYKGGE